ncbi:MAG: DNA alkylation repair protein [Lachnospiraceae bacterium]
MKELIHVLRENSDQEQAVKMASYMKDNFLFLGIPKPKLKILAKPFLAEHRKKPLDWNLIFDLWDLDFREAQYVALLYLDAHKKEIKPEDILQIKRLVTTKSWWETIDSLDEYVGLIALQDDSAKNVLQEWSVDENLWLRRVAIDFQQRYKEKTDKEFLAITIIKNLGSNEFFINKSIGWSLREYSKTNPAWVKDFIDQHRENMSSLSIKEASKYI